MAPADHVWPEIEIPLIPNLAQAAPVLDLAVIEAKPVEPTIVHRVEKPAIPDKDIRSPIRFQHSPEFAWVVGQLEYLHAKRQWRVRYSPSNTDDEFGGVLVLVSFEHLADQFKDGAIVRLRGQLVDPDGHRAAPDYYAWDVSKVD